MSLNNLRMKRKPLLKSHEVNIKYLLISVQIIQKMHSDAARIVKVKILRRHTQHRLQIWGMKMVVEGGGRVEINTS
jgi:hypothetical protein